MANLNEIIAAIDSVHGKLDEVNADVTETSRRLDSARNTARSLSAAGLSQHLDTMHRACEDTTSRILTARQTAERIIAAVQGIIDGSGVHASSISSKPVVAPGSHATDVPRPVLPTAYGPVAKQPGRAPNARHNLNRIGKGAPSKANNTVAIPPTSMDDDVTAINKGEARYEPETQSYVVSGRHYRMKDNGTMYPLDGPGLVNLSREEFNALKTMVKHRGDLDQAWESIRRDPRMSRETFDSVRGRVFRHHKDYKGS